MARSVSFFVAFALASTVAQGRVAAQTNSLFGNRGPASQIGSNLRGSVVGEGTTFGTTTGSTLGLSGQPLTGTQSGLTGQTGASDFVGRGDAAGRFVGDQRAAQQTQGAASRSFGGFGNRARTEGNARSGNQRQPRSGDRQATRVIRPRQKIAFSYPQRPAAEIDRLLQTRMNALVQDESRKGSVKVAVNDQGVATLTGTVDSAEAKRLAAIMARLEPGVRSVDNQLEVVQGSTGQ